VNFTKQEGCRFRSCARARPTAPHLDRQLQKEQCQCRHLLDEWERLISGSAGRLSQNGFLPCRASFRRGLRSALFDSLRERCARSTVLARRCLSIGPGATIAIYDRETGTAQPSSLFAAVPGWGAMFVMVAFLSSPQFAKFNDFFARLIFPDSGVESLWVGGSQTSTSSAA